MFEYDEQLALKTALLEIAETGKANFRFTCNQHLVLADIIDADKNEIDALLDKYGIAAHTDNASAIRKNSMA